MIPSWDDLTPSEREEYVNQDYVPRKYICTNVDTFDSETYNMADAYDNAKLDEVGLEDLLSHLTGRQKQIVEIIYLQGRTQERVAKMLGISRSSVQTHLRRAKDRLKRAFGNRKFKQKVICFCEEEEKPSHDCLGS